MAGSLRSLGTFTADGAAFAGKTRLAAITVTGDGTNIATVTAYDNAAAASGNELAILRATATESLHVTFDQPVQCDNGIYLDVTTAGTVDVVVYVG